MLGDTGDFSNTIYTGFPVPGAGDSVTPFLENDPVLGDVDEHFAGNYLNEETILRAAARQGLSTASIGKLGPALIFDHTERTARPDHHGRRQHRPARRHPARRRSASARLEAAGLPVQAPTRGDNGKAGNAETPGTMVANVEQQD